jgi:predicted Na+-dependent transporter
MHVEWQTAAAFFGYGAIGGIVGAMSKSRRLRLPRVIRRVARDGDHIIEVDSGFLLAPLLGGLVAMIVDGRPETAIGWGLACGYSGPAIVNAIVDGLLKKLGVNTEALPRAEGGAAEDA